MFVTIFITRSMDAKFVAGILRIKLSEAKDKLEAVRKAVEDDGTCPNYTYQKAVMKVLDILDGKAGG